jgi:hypothetical protein
MFHREFVLRRGATLGGMMLPRIVQDDALHQRSRNCEEMPAVVPLHVPLLHQAQIGFMDQSRGCERMTEPLAADAGRSQAFQLAVNQREQLIRGVGIVLVEFPQ